jgi:predicted unusual protein kinase regulating ubiquinone biosynthesis (AarF/ABC1/UbiB family)
VAPPLAGRRVSPRDDEPNERSRGARRQSRIPSGRFERLARIGLIAGETAFGTLMERARRLRSEAPSEGLSLLSRGNAERLASRLSHLRGAAMKLGQLLSLHGEELLPREFTDALSVLRKDADAMPEAQLRRVLARNLGKGWRERFASFDPLPIASASIGQVHAAVAHDGRELALKIQYPGVAQSIESDVDNLAAALRIARILPVGLDVAGIVAEAKAELRREADYLAEAASQERYAELVADEPALVVPRVWREHTTRRVLCMDRLHGVPLEDLRGAEHPQERRDRAGALLYRLLFRELFEWRFMQTDPNLANYLWLPREEKIGLLDFGATRELDATLVANYAEMTRCAIRRDRRSLLGAAHTLNFIDPRERADRVESFLDLLILGAEPLRTPGLYDFGASDLPARVQRLGLDLTFRKGFLRAPPPETLSLQRKLGGTFLVAARLRARVDVDTLAREFLSAPFSA